MIQEAIAEIVELAKAETRIPEKLFIKADDGSGRMWRWDPKSQTYVDLDRVVLRTGNVSNVESLVALIVDEFKLRGKASSGRVVMQNGGAFYVPDVEDLLESFTYKRKFSPQWEALLRVAGKPLPHKAFVRALQTLRPSIEGYGDLMRAYRTINLDGATKVASAPIFNRGTKGNSYSFVLTVRGGETDAELPSELKLSLPVVKGSIQTYELDAEIDVEYNDGDPRFSLVISDVDDVLRQVEADETAWLRTALKSSGLGDILVIENYA